MDRRWGDLVWALVGPLVVASGCGDDGSRVTTTFDDAGGTVTATSTGTSTGDTSAVTSEGPTGGTTSTSSASTDATSGTAGVEDTGTTGGTDAGTSQSETTSPTSTDSGTTGGTTGGSTGTTAAVCPFGEIVCMADVAYQCDGMGGLEEVEDCAPQFCADGIGCVLCQPGSYDCNGDDVMICNNSGDGYDVQETCDGFQGITCDANAGGCVGECASLGLTYQGCDYYPTVTANVVDSSFNFAVIVSNSSNQTADITITKGAAIVTQTTVAANSVEVIDLPWVENLKQSGGPPGASLVEIEGAYRLRSTRRVTVYQYSPIEYTNGLLFSYTNDASLLLPVNTWGDDYFLAARNTWRWQPSLFQTIDYPGFYAVIASQDDTTVTVEPSSTGDSNIIAGAGIGANGQGVVVLDQSDVLEVFSGGTFANPSPVDLTGTRITADKPIQVISGHQCTFVPHDVGYCDHIEESMLSFDALATEYVVTTPMVQPPLQNSFPKQRFVRVIATTDNTTLSYDPPQVGAPTAIATAGDYVEIGPTDADFSISSNFKVVVAEYMQGQEAGGDTGDPAMALAVPTAQYRTDYLFHAPTNYEANFVNITAPTGATITLDGAVVMNFAPIGNTGYEIAREPLSNLGDGTHEITGDQPFGVTVYGYGQYTSYWYPGGLDLEVIPQ